MKKAARNLLIGTFSGAVLLVGLGTYFAKAGTNQPQDSSASQKAAADEAAQGSVIITDLQLKSVNVAPAAMREFASESQAVGYIDFNQASNVQVFSPWQGRITQIFGEEGTDVKKGQVLFTIDSPDLVQAESTLISTAGVLALTTKTLDRAKQMLDTQAAAQKDVEQATSDQQTADGAYKAARDAVRIFGKSDAEIDAIVTARRTNGELRIVSPFSGRITARNASIGLLVQPGTTPAPFTVADISTMWMIANVSEYDLPHLKLGQPVAVSVAAYPGRTFNGKITNIGAALDPNTHRAAVRSEINDPNHELHAQMLANFAIRTGQPSHNVAIPAGGVVREGDGTMTVFVTKDSHRFTRRVVQLGAEQDGVYPVLDGLSAGEQVASDGALFLSNALALQTR